MADWSYPDNMETTLYDHSGITMPISLMIGSKDTQCVPTRAYELGGQLSGLQNEVTFKGADHGLGTYGGERFYNILAAELTSETGEVTKTEVDFEGYDSATTPFAVSLIVAIFTFQLFF